MRASSDKNQRTNVRPSERQHTPTQKVDREKSCPFLIRVFYKVGSTHRVDEFDGDKRPAEEVQVYSWFDANLREISEHI
jgi:hypothetical protein